MKLLIVLLAVLLLLWLLFGRKRGPRGGAPPRDAEAAVEGMIACAHCGAYVPASEALHRDGLAYCGAAHRDAGPAAGRP
jgi:uncharacterized protein